MELWGSPGTAFAVVPRGAFSTLNERPELEDAPRAAEAHEQIQQLALWLAEIEASGRPAA